MYTYQNSFARSMFSPCRKLKRVVIYHLYAVDCTIVHAASPSICVFRCYTAAQIIHYTIAFCHVQLIRRVLRLQPVTKQSALVMRLSRKNAVSFLSTYRQTFYGFADVYVYTDSSLCVLCAPIGRCMETSTTALCRQKSALPLRWKQRANPSESKANKQSKSKGERRNIERERIKAAGI